MTPTHDDIKRQVPVQVVTSQRVCQPPCVALRDSQYQTAIENNKNYRNPRWRLCDRRITWYQR